MALHLLAVALQSLARLDHSADCVRHLFVFPSLRVLNKTRRQSNCPYEIDTIKKTHHLAASAAHFSASLPHASASAAKS